MNRRHHALLAPLLAVLALLLGLAGSASAAFNAAATDPHYGNFLLHTEAPAQMPLEAVDPTRENGVWLYDSTLGVPVYVNQNPWTHYDPLGLQLDYADDSMKLVISKMRAVDPRLDSMVAALEGGRHTHTLYEYTAKRRKDWGDGEKSRGVVIPLDGSNKIRHDAINGKGLSTNIYVSTDMSLYSKGKDDKSSSDPQSTMAHELQHALDYENGTFAKKIDPDSKTGALTYVVNEKSDQNVSEERAVRTQNIYEEKVYGKSREEYGDRRVENPGSKFSPLNETPTAGAQRGSQKTSEMVETARRIQKSAAEIDKLMEEFRNANKQ